MNRMAFRPIRSMLAGLAALALLLALPVLPGCGGSTGTPTPDKEATPTMIPSTTLPPDPSATDQPSDTPTESPTEGASPQATPTATQGASPTATPGPSPTGAATDPDLTDVSGPHDSPLPTGPTLEEIRASTPGRLVFVAKTGDDGNPGTEDKPFLTLGAAAKTLEPGDTCLVRTGIYRETVTPPSGTQARPIRLMAYPGERVVVSGADRTALVWTKHRGAIYKAAFSGTTNQLFVDGRMMVEARWPNAQVDRLLFADFAATGSGTDHLSLNDPALPDGDWTGATVHMWPGDEWIAITRLITSQEGKRLTYDRPYPLGDAYIENDPYAPRPGNRYFLSGTLAALDAPGEWFLDRKAGQLYLYAPDGKSPDTHRVEVRKRPFSFVLDNQSDVLVSGFESFGAAISMIGSVRCTADRIDMRYHEHFTEVDGYAATWAYRLNRMTGRDNVFRNSRIAFSAGDGIRVGGVGNRVENCLLRDLNYAGAWLAPIMTEPEAGASVGAVISRCTIRNAGRNSILFQLAEQLTIEYCDVSKASLLVKDCGLISAWGTDGKGSVIRYNWAHDNVGKWTCGIYLDNYCRNFTIHHNVVWNVSDAAIRINSPGEDIGVYNNTILNGSQAFGTFTYSMDVPSQKGSRFFNNLYTGAFNRVTNENAPEIGFNLAFANLADILDGAYLPIAGSPALDAGTEIPGVTDGFVGSAPDIGAYEKGLPRWVPGADWEE